MKATFNFITLVTCIALSKSLKVKFHGQKELFYLNTASIVKRNNFINMLGMLIKVIFC